MAESRVRPLSGPSLAFGERAQVARRPSPLKRWGPPATLFAATLVTTSFCGAFWAGSPLLVTDVPELLRHHELGAVLRLGFPFAATLLAILLSHELGHFFTAKYHRVETSPPYFIPMPLLVGTMGAIIRLRGRIPNRRALVDVGASGPLAGFLVGLPLFAWGVQHSPVEVMPPSPLSVPTGSLIGVVAQALAGGTSSGGTVILEGHSLLYQALIFAFHGQLAPGMDLVPHPVAMAAWFGMFVTALNLLPVGQLDGGHVLYAVLGPRARTVGRVVVWTLVALGVVGWLGWLVWAVLAGRLVGTRHPPVEDPTVELGRARRWIAYAALALFVLTFAPVPLQVF